MSPRRTAARAAGALRRAGWPSLVGGCLLWAAWSEAAVGAGLPTRSGAGSAVLLAVTALALAREAALRDGAAPRRAGAPVAALASLVVGALVSLAGGAVLPAAESAQVVPRWDAAVLASLAAGAAAVAAAGWRARPRVGHLALSLALAVPVGGLCEALLRAARLALPGDLAAMAGMVATFAALWLVVRPMRLLPLGGEGERRGSS